MGGGELLLVAVPAAVAVAGEEPGIGFVAAVGTTIEAAAAGSEEDSP